MKRTLRFWAKANDLYFGVEVSAVLHTSDVATYLIDPCRVGKENFNAVFGPIPDEGIHEYTIENVRRRKVRNT